TGARRALLGDLNGKRPARGRWASTSWTGQPYRQLSTRASGRANPRRAASVSSGAAADAYPVYEETRDLPGGRWRRVTASRRPRTVMCRWPSEMRTYIIVG